METRGELPADLLVVEVLRGGPKQKLGLVEVEPAALREGEVPREAGVGGDGLGLEREREDEVRAVEAIGQHDAVPGRIEVRVVALDELQDFGGADVERAAGGGGGGGGSRAGGGCGGFGSVG